MPISSNLNTFPYQDDFNPDKDYYKVLFKPGAAVQTRELNQLQSILQHQIELFGDNLFDQGTIIDGCNFIFYPNYPYVKLLDNDVNGIPLNVFGFDGFNVKDSSNVVALIVDEVSGFEATDPDLNTIYLKYLNSGANGSISTFTSGEIVTIYNGNNVIQSVNILNGSSGFSNSDSVVFCSSIAVQNTSGGIFFANGTGGSNCFNVGDIVNYSNASANVRASIISVNGTANASVLILNIKPITADLGNISLSAASWTFPNLVTAHELTTNTTVVVIDTIGQEASASLITDSFGTITNLPITNFGSGYYVMPFTTLRSRTGSYANLSLNAQGFLTQIQVANTTNAVGIGYGFGVTDGVIYQKGYFLKVSASTIVVDKYSNTPDQVSVGFNTAEFIANSNFDPSLLDNSTGTPNFAAPGADRLQLIPNLVVLDNTDVGSNGFFFSICEWSFGNPFKQNRVTAYNTIESEIAQRTEDINGDFVIQPFFITTKSANTLATESNSYIMVVNPGSAYVGGFKVETETLFYEPEPKGITTRSLNPSSTAINYGAYILVNQYAGHFVFDTGAIVSLRDTAATFVSNTTAIQSSNSTGIAAPGAEIGQARIRSIIYDGNLSGLGAAPGSPGTRYRLYLFDIAMNQGKSFSNVKSVFSNNAFTGIADVITPCVLQQPSNNSLIFPLGINAVANVSNVVYTYRTTKTVTANSTGYVNITAGTDENFLNTGVLSVDTILVPQVNVIAANATGTVTIATTSSNVVSSGTSFTSFVAGDWIILRDGTHTDVHQVLYVVNSSVMIIDSNTSYSNTTGTVALLLPQNLPVPLTRIGRNISITGSNMTINLANSFGTSANMTITYSGFTNNDTPIAKTVHRDVMVQLNLSNNVAGVTGPWILGIPDVIRLKHVYRGTSTANSDIVGNFVIGSGQKENFVDTSKLVLKNGTSLSLTTGDNLLVVFDCFTSSQNHGPFAMSSWPINDTISLSSSTASINTLEIPEVNGNQGAYYDLRDCIDFRPITANTANLATSNTTATVNPIATTSTTKFGNTANLSNDMRFPYPISTVNTSINYYLGRKDLATINSNGDFNVILGKSDIMSKVVVPATPKNSLPLNIIDVPPYPSLPLSLSSNTSTFLNTNVINNNKFVGQRKDNYTIQIEVSAANTISLQPSGYTMKDIAILEERIKNLEAVVLIAQLNSSIQEEVSGTVYGFIADDFSTYDFSDQANPSYNASIFNNELIPRTKQLNLPFDFSNPDGGSVTFPWIAFPLATQPFSTTIPVGNTTPAPNTSPNTTPVALQQLIQEFAAQSPSGDSGASTLISNGSGGTIQEAIWDIFNFKFSATTGPAKLITNSFEVPDKWYVFQHPNPTLPADIRSMTSNVAHNNPLATGVWTPYLVTTSDSTINCTPAEFASIGTQTVFDGIPGQPDLQSQTNWSFKPAATFIGGNFVDHVGKLEWTHDPTKGLYYTILVIKADQPLVFGGNGDAYNFYLYYPSDQPLTVAQIASKQPVLVDYNGIMQTAADTTSAATISTFALLNSNAYSYFYNPATFLEDPIVTASNNSVVTVAQQQLFTFQAQGLKPSTNHNFIFGGVDNTINCKQTGTVLGSGLSTDKYGQIQFDFIFAAPNQTTATTIGVIHEQAVATYSANTLCTIASPDGTSYASFILGSAVWKYAGL